MTRTRRLALTALVILPTLSPAQSRGAVTLTPPVQRRPAGYDPAGSAFCAAYRCTLLGVKAGPDATYRQYQVGTGGVQLVVGVLPGGGLKGAALAEVGAGALNGAVMRDVYTRSFAASFLGIQPGGSVLKLCGGGLNADARGAKLGYASGTLSSGRLGRLVCLATRAGQASPTDMVNLVGTR